MQAHLCVGLCMCVCVLPLGAGNHMDFDPEQDSQTFGLQTQILPKEQNTRIALNGFCYWDLWFFFNSPICT